MSTQTQTSLLTARRVPRTHPQVPPRENYSVPFERLDALDKRRQRHRQSALKDNGIDDGEATVLYYG